MESTNMESRKRRRQNEEAERLARRNKRSNKIQGVKNTDDFRNNMMGSKKEAELFLKNGNDTEVMQTN